MQESNSLRDMNGLMKDIDLLESVYQAALASEDFETVNDVLRELDAINKQLDKIT